MALVAYLINKRKRLDDGRNIVHATLTLGDGASTYPAGGIPLSGALLGCPRQVDSITVEDSATTNLVKYDKVNKKLRIYVQDGGTEAYAEMTGVVPAETVAALVIGSN